MSLPRLQRHFSVLMILALLFVGAVGAVLAQEYGPAGPSPATGHASVVSNSSVMLTGEPSRWHATRHAADAAAAPLLSDSPGFLIAENTPLLVTFTDTGLRYRLAGDEAIEVPASTEMLVQTFGAPDTFIFLQLLPESGTQLAPATDRLLTSASFETPEGLFDTDLLRDVLAEDEVMTIPAGSLPTSIVVLVGEVTVEDDRSTVTLAAGEAAIFEGEATVTAIADGSVLYAGFVGAPIQDIATPVPETPAATPAPATPIPATPVPATPIPATPVPTEDPLAAIDTDDDGLNDAQELELGTDPENPDTDDDGLTDGDEVNVHNTDPLNMDTDSDLFYDGGEIIRGTDPLIADTDEDALLDGEEEYIYNTDPLNPDTDGDGVSDGVEVQNGTDPLDPADS